MSSATLATGGSSRTAQGERDALSHTEFLLIWGHLCKRRNKFSLVSLLRWEISIKDPGRISPCLLIKNINFNKSNSNFTAPRLGHNTLWEMRKDGQKEGVLIIITFFN
jgi:hypothetical protein